MGTIVNYIFLLLLDPCTTKEFEYPIEVVIGITSPKSPRFSINAKTERTQ